MRVHHPGVSEKDLGSPIRVDQPSSVPCSRSPSRSASAGSVAADSARRRSVSMERGRRRQQKRAPPAFAQSFNDEAARKCAVVAFRRLQLEMSEKDVHVKTTAEFPCLSPLVVSA